MASLTTDARGIRRIQFNDGTARRTIHLGDVDKKTAVGIKLHVERLINAKLFGQPLPSETAGWLAAIGETLHGRLVAAGLTTPRQAPPAITLVNIIDNFTKHRGPTVKPGTRLVWQQARKHLCKFFTDSRPANSITPADADDFRRYIRGQYSEAFTAKMVMVAKSFFRDAARRKLIDASPFTDVQNGSQRNASRQRFIEAATIQKAIEATPDIEWRLMIALARFGGLRVPSEPLALRWADVNWSESTMAVRSAKTERHAGGGVRIVPIFPELRPLLMEAFEQAAPGEQFVITRWRTAAVNLRKGFESILTKAGIAPWPRLWQNLRASRATELADLHPGHVCAAWLGHTEAIANKHYRQVTTAHIAAATAPAATPKAAESPGETDAKTPTQIPTQQPSETARNARKPLPLNSQKGLVFPENADACLASQQAGWAIRDSNPLLHR